MLTPGPEESSTKLGTLLWTAAFSCVFLLAATHAAQPFNTATITKLENKVNYGERRAGRSSTRPASVADTLRANNFLLSEADSRAELQYPDGTLVRIGQNTVFSFDAESRTLELDKGSMIFHMPKGAGGGVIKTPSITAAISGTTVKVSVNYMAVVEGSLKLVPSGRTVQAGEFVRRNGNGTITIAPFDESKTNDGKLVDWRGLMPGFQRKAAAIARVPLPEPDLRALEVLHRANNLPNSIERFFAIRPRGIRVPRDRNDGNDNNNGGVSIY